MSSRLEREVAREYRRLAPVYDVVWRRYIRTSARHTLDALAPDDGERLLDVGCGTGVLLASIRSRAPGAELHGVDLTPQMLARARRRLGPGVTLHRASARSLPYPDDHFDAVASSSMLHYLAADAPSAVREWRRVLRPGGRLAVTDWCADHRGTRAQSWLLERVLRRPYAALSQGELLGLLDDAGFSVERVVRYRAGVAWGVMTVAAR